MSTRKALLPYWPGGKHLAKLHPSCDLIAKETFRVIPIARKRESL